MLAKFLEDTENYDSISQYTDSTLPSEYVAQQIANYNKDLLNESDLENDSGKVQYVNIRVDALNIYGENEGGYFSGTEGSESIPLRNFSEVLRNTVLKNVEASHRSGNIKPQGHQPGVIRSKNLRTKICIGGCILLIAVITFVLVSSKFMSRRDQVVSIANRSLWKADLGRIGSKPLKVPAKRVIVMPSNSSQSCDVDSCRPNLIKEQFSGFYPENEDIKANYILGADGTVFEGRGFYKEGQMSYDRFGTSYNRDALEIKINCIENEISEVQMNSLKSFLDKFVKQTLIQNNYMLFYHEQLVQGGRKDEKVYEKLKRLEHFVDTPEMISNWSSVPSIEHKYNIEETIKSAVEIEYSQTSECHNQNECMELMNTLQSSGKYHIVIGGNFVFQMKSIDELDVTPDDDRQKLFVLCIGTFNETLPEGLISNLNNVLTHFVNAGKLCDSYISCLLNGKPQEHIMFLKQTCS